MKDKFDFNKQEDFRRAERLAYNDMLDCTDFPPPEYKYFSELQKVYQAFKFDGLSKEDAERQKKSLLIDYQKYLENFTYCKSVWGKYQDNIKISEMLMTKIQKSYNMREIAETAIRVISLMTSNEVFLKTNLEKLEALK